MIDVTDARAYLQNLTASRFPEFQARIDHRGGLVCLPFGDLPTTWMDGSQNYAHGRAEWVYESDGAAPEAEFDYTDRFEFYIILEYKDKFLDLHESYADVRRDLW